MSSQNAVETVWRKLKPVSAASPGARRYHTAVLDVSTTTTTTTTATADHMWVFGGTRPKNVVLADVWVFEEQAPGQWSWREVVRREGSSAWPAARYGHSAVMFDHRMWVMGGVAADGVTALDDVWCLDCASGEWTRMGEGPAGRYHHAAVVVPSRRSMLVHGGAYSNKKYRTDLWEYHFDQDSWTRLNEGEDGAGPGGLAGNALITVTDSETVRIMSYGGYTGDGGFTALSSLFSFDFNTGCWQRDTEYETTYPPDNDAVEGGTMLTPATGRAIVATPTPSGLVWVFGGYAGKHPTGGLFVFNPREILTCLTSIKLVKRWLSVELWMEMDAASMAKAAQSNGNPRPVPRYGHSAVLLNSGDTLLVYGGSGSMYLDDVMAIDLPAECQ